MLNDDFNYLINQLGTNIYLNDETKPRKVLLSSRRISRTEINFDDRMVHTNFKIKRGDTIKYNNVLYLVFSDVQAKRGHEYQALIRPMTNSFEFTYWTEGGIVDYDRFNNPIYDPPPEEVTESLPCVAYQEGSPAIEGDKIRLPETRIKVVMPDNHAT